MPSPITRRTFLGTSMGVLASLALVGCSGSNTLPETEDVEEVEGEGTKADEAADADSGASLSTGPIMEPLDNGYAEGLHHATMEIEGFGTVKLELNATNTPVTVSNFAELVNQGFYDGLTFHRINQNMIQGGDPTGTGAGGSSRSIKGEFFQNGVANAIRHKRGVISMARSSDMNSGDSQFFILFDDCEDYDGRYAAFGKVTDGMDVIDAIVANTPVENEMVAAENQPRITSIRMDD